MKWIDGEIASEVRALERARRRFERKPSENRLHDVRTTGRRLRSLLADVADFVKLPRLRRKVRRAAALTDAARDGAVLLALLEANLDESERALAAPLTEALHAQMRSATAKACKGLRRLAFEKP